MSQTKRQSRGHEAEDRFALKISRRAVVRAAGIGALSVAGGYSLAASARVADAQGLASSTIAVYPADSTRTAPPTTEVSFRGDSIGQLGQVTVTGSESGAHSGVMVSHSDERGASYLPDAPFAPGESVTVRAELPLSARPDGSMAFTVAQPPTTVSKPESVAPDERATSQAFQSRPDLLPPPIEVTTPADGTAPGYIFIGAKIPEGQNGVMILDNDGELIWFLPGAVATDVHHDVRVQSYRGQPVLTWWEGSTAVGYGLGHFVICNGSYERIAELQVGNGYSGGDLHEFLLTPRGTALVIVYNPIRWDLSPVDGPLDGTAMDGVVQEIDVETGRVLFEWHTLDHIELDESYIAAPQDANVPFDYVHLNSIEEQDDTLVLCARHTFAVYSVDKGSGDILWRLNGKASDFTMGPDTPFAYAHDARFQPSGELTLFDNASANQESDDTVDSRGIVLDLDLGAMTATLVREHIHPTGILSVSQGNMQMLPNGNACIGWGSAPVFTEFTEDGDVCFNGRLPIGGTSYRAYRFPWKGHPVDPPDIAVERGTGDTVTVHASWNGATEVASWQVLAGPDPGQLQPVTSAPRDGFETAITVQTAEPYLAVEALDASGRVLGTSEAVQLGA